MRRLRTAAFFILVGGAMLVGDFRVAAADLHPVIPAFERFHTNPDAMPADAGRLLLGELDCVACHQADSATREWIAPKPAPVLTQVARRVRPEFLHEFLKNPSAAKPGATMPQILSHDAVSGDAQTVEALVHFLSADGSLAELKSDRDAAERGERLFHSIGCVACHDARTKKGTDLATSVPLPVLSNKYSVLSLAEFLRNPHAVRPGGRMPDFKLTEVQSLELAHYLIPDANPQPQNPRLTYQIFAGNFSTLPRFNNLKPLATGEAGDFDISLAGRTSEFAIAFEGFLKVETPGSYSFIVGSDDGSRLYINGEMLVDNDGDHPYTVVFGTKSLPAGVHPLRLEYSQVGGGQQLTVEYTGPGQPQQKPLIGSVFLTREAQLPKKPAAPDGSAPFELDTKLVAQGRKIFAEAGCANCHTKQEGREAIASSRTAPPFTKLLATAKAGSSEPAKGCLAERPAHPAADYHLSDHQRSTIQAALSDWAAKSIAQPTPVESIELTLERFNCLACHSRAGKGGVEPERDGYFTTTVPEMGDEGRIPPHLTGAGDKLQQSWLQHVFTQGAEDRTYMRTRMPVFGSPVGNLAEHLAKVDQHTELPLPEVPLPKHRSEAVGRQLVGDKALSCIKCHNVGSLHGTGIQSINLQTMARRLRSDWFHRYMLDPQKYRPGTRMPLAFPNGKSVVPAILDGDAHQQLASIWDYLKLGGDAAIPSGVLTDAIVLTPVDRPIIYRNFIDNASPSSIAVGYVEKVNLVFDPTQLCLAMIWHNGFIDASKHWSARGAGEQRPIGDHLLSLVGGVPIAQLKDARDSWPTGTAAENGWTFGGYSLDSAGKPIFHYANGDVAVDDAFEPLSPGTAELPDASLKRTFAVRAKSQSGALGDYRLRLAAGAKIEDLGNGKYRVDGLFTIHLPSAAGIAKIRDSGGRQELLLTPQPTLDATEFDVTVHYYW